jgi:hypothetical protein
MEGVHMHTVWPYMFVDLLLLSVFPVVVAIGIAILYWKKGGWRVVPGNHIELEDDPYAAALTAHDWDEMVAGDYPSLA